MMQSLKINPAAHYILEEGGEEERDSEKLVFSSKPKQKHRNDTAVSGSLF